MVCCFFLNNLCTNALSKQNESDYDIIPGADEKILSRQKRLEPISIISGILIGALGSVGTVSLTEYYRASASDECAITIKYRAKLAGYGYPTAALNMNFKADYDDNWNYEKITNWDSVDTTKEKVTGGKLKLIQIYPEGKFCVQGITISCGSQLNRLNSERSVILDVPTIRNAWFRQGNPRFLEVDWDKNCMWFSNMDYKSVRAIDVYPNAFTNCQNAEDDCISKHIEVF